MGEQVGLPVGGNVPEREDNVAAAHDDSEALSGGEDHRLLVRGNAPMVLPTLHGGRPLAECAGHWPDATEPIEKGISTTHNLGCTEKRDSSQARFAEKPYRRRTFFQQGGPVEPAAVRLKRLRTQGGPSFSIRRVAAELEMTPSSYAYYEDAKQFKKPYLPIELVKKLVDVLNADFWDVMELAGLREFEHDGEIFRRPDHSLEAEVAQGIRPELQLVTLQVALPSEAALARMFEGLLRPLDREMPVDELARTLARRLPTGLAQLRDLMPAHLASDHDEDARPPATDRPEQPPSRRT